MSMLWNCMQGFDSKQKAWFIRGGPSLQAQAACCLNAEVGAERLPGPQANNCKPHRAAKHFIMDNRPNYLCLHVVYAVYADPCILEHFIYLFCNRLILDIWKNIWKSHSKTIRATKMGLNRTYGSVLLTQSVYIFFLWALLKEMSENQSNGWKLPLISLPNVTGPDSISWNIVKWKEVRQKDGLNLLTRISCLCGSLRRLNIYLWGTQDQQHLHGLFCSKPRCYG